VVGGAQKGLADPTLACLEATPEGGYYRVPFGGTGAVLAHHQPFAALPSGMCFVWGL